MCQLNLYIIPKCVDIQKVLDIMKEHLDYNKPECVNDDNFLPELQNNYNIFISAGMRCNCNTIQGFYQDHQNITWSELKKELINKEQTKLLEIKQVLQRPDYKEYKNQFNNKSNEYSAQMQSAKGEEYNNALENLQKLFSEHSALLTASTFYERYTDDTKSTLDFTAIDNAIANVEKKTIVTQETEYVELKNFIDEILKHTNEIKLYSFWQDSEPLYIKNEKQLYQDELKIDNIIYLNYNELLTIEKRT